MKKMICLFIASLAIVSCSNDEKKSDNKNSKLLVSKVIHTYGIDDITISHFKYEGNKIVSETTDSGFVAKYTYSEDVITKIEETVDDKFQRLVEYTYRDGKVLSRLERANYGGTDVFYYTYNSNGTVSYKRTRTGSEDSTGLLTILNGNIIKNEEFYGGQYNSKATYTYSYDAKNNPFKNVLGFNLLLDTNENMFSSNNMIIDGGGEPANNYIYKYNEFGFATEKRNTERRSDGSYIMDEYFY